MWEVKKGPCKVNGGFCVTSGGYEDGDEEKSQKSRYGSKEMCQIKPDGKGAAIEVANFNTEEKYDKLIVNGKSYSGDGGSLNGVVPSGTMKWTTDKGNEQSGWKICFLTTTTTTTNKGGKGNDYTKVGNFDGDGKSKYGIYVGPAL